MIETKMEELRNLMSPMFMHIEQMKNGRYSSNTLEAAYNNLNKIQNKLNEIENEVR